MSVQPSTTINRQQSRQAAAAADRYASNASRRGDQGDGRNVEPTRPPAETTPGLRFMVATGATPISGMRGRYTGSLLGVAVDVTATGDLAVADVGVSYGSVELWFPPDITASSPQLLTTDLLLVNYDKVHSTRAKPICVVWNNPRAGGGTGGSSKWFKMTGGVSAYEIQAQGWSGSALDGTTVNIITTMAHASGDLLYASLLANTSPAKWIEVPNVQGTQSRYQVLQIVDTVGRWGFDWVRAH